MRSTFKIFLTSAIRHQNGYISLYFYFDSVPPLREMFQIRDFSALPKITFQKVKNSLFLGTLRDCYLTKC